ncbi:MAG TPA: tetraacyldisaccharide 4'-kinase [Burkholderiaceae bacterium]|nr:tetraacyldisaccharide 4'-kinase [Burkholderiaceae bacterium]
MRPLADAPRARAGFGTRLESALAALWWRPERRPLAQALRPLAALYAGLAALQRTLATPQRIGAPVVVVGNLIVGGAGKTPTVIALVRLLRALGWTPGVISRGHGRRSRGLVEVTRNTPVTESGDEPLLIHLRSGAPLVVGADRVAAAQALRSAHPEVDIVVSDDGLQHHRLARDLQVVVFDERGIGNGLRLPAGPLREALPATAPPDTLVLYNAERPTTRLPGWMAVRRLAGLVPLADWWRGAAPAADSWRTFEDRPAVALAGIASPQRFFDMLHAQGLNVLPRALPDHHDFVQLPWRAGTDDVIVTEKDAVKLAPDRDLFGARVWVAPLDFEPDIAFVAALMRHLPRHPAP